MVNTDFNAYRFNLNKTFVEDESDRKNWIIENVLFEDDNVYGSFFSCIYRGELRIHVVFYEDTDAHKKEILSLFTRTLEKTHLYSGKVWIGNGNSKVVQYLQEAFNLVLDSERFMYESHQMAVKRESFHRMSENPRLEARPYEDENLRDYLVVLQQAMTFKIPPFPYVRKEDELREEFSRLKESFEAFWMGDKLVGLYILSGCEVDQLAVAPEYQHLGYGEIILSKAIERIFENEEYDTAWLLVVEWNSKAFAFYRKFGLIETEAYHVLFADV